MYAQSERGLSEVLGAILMFALVISGLALFQVNAVPAANERVEFDHSRAVQEDFLDVDARVSTAASLGASQSVVVDTGLTYPNRFVLVNPGPVSGSLTAEAAPFTVLNANATGETADYWDGSERPFDSQRLVYYPAYNHYEGPVTALEAGVVYNTFDNGAVLQVDRGSFISANRISLVALAGDVGSASGDSVAVEMVPLSAPTETVRVTNAPGENVTIRLATPLDASVWADILEDETTAGHVVAVVPGPTAGTVDVVLEQGVTYDLRVSKVGVGSGTTAETPSYLTTVGAKPTVLNAGGNEFRVQLRDQFNGPVAGETVSFAIDRTNATDTTATAVTDDDGVATVTVTPVNNESVTVTAYYDADADGVRNDGAQFVVRYPNIGAPDELPAITGDLKNINDAEKDVRLGAVSFKGGTKDTISVEFVNNGSRTYTFTEARISFVLASGDPTLAELTRTDVNPDEAVGTLEVKGTFVNITDVAIGGSGDTATIEFEFDQNLEQGAGGGGQAFDWLVVLTVEVTDDSGELEYLTFFITD